MTDQENQRRLNEWRLKENLPITTPVSLVKPLIPTGSNPSTPLHSNSPSTANQIVTPRIASAVPSIDGDDDDDEEDDGDDDDDDDGENDDTEPDVNE